MGRGDKRTFRGKISAGSYGNTRPQKVKKKAAAKPPGAAPAKAPAGR
jgi:30S ribosomal protein S31